MNPYLARFYSGELAAPIPRPAHDGLLGPGADEIERYVREQRMQKLPALFAHFDIDPGASDAWQRLALALADEHVPGFGLQRPLMPNEWLPWSKPRRRRGRPRKPASVLPGGGLLGSIQAPAPKRPAHRPATFTSEEKRGLIRDFEQRIAAVKEANPQCVTTKAAAEHEFGSEGQSLLAIIRRFKRELASVEKSEKFAETERILRGFGRRP